MIENALQLQPIQDTNYIRDLLKRDNLYKGILGTDTDIETQHIDTTSTFWYQGVLEDKVIGIFIIQPFTKTIWNFHGGVFKEYRGNTVSYLKQALAQVPSNYEIYFMTTVHKDNRLANRLHEKSGFVYKTTIGDTNIYAEEE